METLQIIITFISALIGLYFCAVLMSSSRSSHMAYQLSSFFLSHAAGLQGYRAAWSKTRKACAKKAALAQNSRAEEEATSEKRQKTVTAAHPLFERRVTN